MDFSSVRLFMIEEWAKKYNTRAALLNYLIHIDDKRRIAYLETPKVACTSIKKYMQDRYHGEVVVLENHNKVHDRSLSPLKAPRDLSNKELGRLFEGNYRRFSFVRNPFTRVLSAYLDKIVENNWERERHLPKLGFTKGAQVSFLEFLEAVVKVPDRERDIHYASQASLLLAGQVEMDFIGAFERFDADFAAMKGELYSDKVEDNYAGFGRHHATNASDKVKLFYGEKEITLVQQIFTVDFEIYGYSKKLEKFGLSPTLEGCLC